jgi:hypothetical protein
MEDTTWETHMMYRDNFRIGWFRLVYSCCSRLEHRTSAKHFVSLQFLNLGYLAGLLGQVISLSQGRYLTQVQKKHKQTSMPQVRFEPTIPAFKRAKTVHALDRAATVIGNFRITPIKICCEDFNFTGSNSWLVINFNNWKSLNQLNWHQLQRSSLLS